MCITDNDILEALYRRYYGAAYLYCVTLCGGAHTSRTPEDPEQHFKSLLQYSMDRVAEGKGIPMVNALGEDMYASILEYVEENGVTCYGCMIVASPEALLALADSGLVSMLQVTDAWLDI